LITKTKLKSLSFGIFLGVAVTFTLLLILDPLDAFGQGPPPSGGPPKVDIFARQMGDSILVTWENPDDTANDVVFRYVISRDVNRSEIFTQIFASERDIEEQIIDERNGQEMFFLLDENVIGGNEYTYQVSASAVQGNPNPTLSDDTRPIFVRPQIEFLHSQSDGHLIVGRTLTPITLILSFIDWLNPFQLVNAEDDTVKIFTTLVNPQQESFRLALEPISNPNGTQICDQLLEFEYSKDFEDGQDFQIVATILETQTFRDDHPNGTITEQDVQFVRHQKVFSDISTSTKLKQKWLQIPPEDQKIKDFSRLEVQFDITGLTASPLDFRSLTMHQTVFFVPVGNNVC
jgi:hypothetical protein